MQKQIAILCLAVFCFAFFAVAAHDHGAVGPQHDCAICLLSFLSFASASSAIHIYHSWTRSVGPSFATVILPEAFLARLDARAPPE